MKKRALSLLLVLTLCLAMAVPAFAAGETTVTGSSGTVYTLSNGVIGTEEWEHGVSDDKQATVTDTVYLVPEGTVVTAPEGTEWSGFTSYSDLGDGWESLSTGPLSGKTFEIGLYLYETQTAKGDNLYFRGVKAAETTPTTETPSSWAVEQVNAAIKEGIVPEALQSKYTQATTRAEFCALAVALYETVKGSEITERSTFSDTTDVNVEKMAALGVVTGVGDNKFSPDSSLTREQAATMLSRLADVIGKPLTEQAPTFADNASVSSWAFDAVGQMQATNVMGGVGNNTFSPSTNYTHEQSIITIMRLFDIVK